MTPEYQALMHDVAMLFFKALFFASIISLGFAAFMAHCARTWNWYDDNEKPRPRRKRIRSRKTSPYLVKEKRAKRWRDATA